jgi:Flp pilus assembly protein TadD
MKNRSFLIAAVRRHFLQDGKMLLRFPVIAISLFLLTSCASSQDKTGANLERQIKFQHMEQQLIAEPVSKEKRTAAEFEEQGDRYLLRGDNNRAYIYYAKGLGVAPDNVSLIHKQGVLLLKKSKFGEAEAVYEKLLTVNSKDSAALEGRGKATFGQGKFPEAEQDFLAALAINPGHWQSQEFLGLIHSRRQEYDQAINRFKAALGQQPWNESISNNLAVTYYLKGDFKEAVLLLKGLVKTTQNRKVYNNLALASFQLGLYDEAMDAFRRGSENEAVAYNNMGSEFFTSKRYKEAIQAFEKAIDLHPKFYPSAQNNLLIANHALSNAAAEATN